MKKNLVLIFLSLISYQFAKAQRDTSVIYMNNTGSVVLSKNLADYFIAILPPDPEQDPNLFTVKAYYSSGKIMMQTMSSTSAVPLRFQGPYVAFFENGHRKQFATYENGLVKGDIINYYLNGQVHNIIHQTGEGGQVLYLEECRDSTGKVMCKGGNGQWEKLSDDLKDKSEGPVVNGKENGEWQGNIGDSIKFTCIYKKGDAKSGTGYDAAGKAYPFKKIYESPAFGFGVDVFSQFLSRTKNYPEYAIAHNLHGVVKVGFTIEKDGSVDGIHIMNGVAPTLDQEAMRVVGQSPRWVPAKLFGVPVSTKYHASLYF